MENINTTADETNVEWFKDGERGNATVFNRPIKSIASILNSGLIDIINNSPKIKPTFHLNFLNDGVLDSRVTFTRSTTGTYFDDVGILRTAAIDVPRFNYNPENGECEGLLFEDTAWNYLTYSEDFTNVDWVKANITLGTGSLSPNGIDPMFKITEDTSDGLHMLSQDFTTVAGNPYTFSCFLKGGTREKIRLHGAGNTIGVTFNTTTGEMNTENVDATPISYGMKLVDPIRMIWRCHVSYISTNEHIEAAAKLINVTSTEYIGDGTSYAYVWGMQLEDGYQETSYITTTDASVSRGYDEAIINGTRFSDWFNQYSGTFLFEYDRKVDNQLLPHSMFLLGDATGQNRIYHTSGTGNSMNEKIAFMTGGSVVQDIIVTTTPTQYTEDGLTRRLSLRFGPVECGVGYHGVITPEITYEKPEFTFLRIGGRVITNFLNGHLKRIMFFPKGLSDDELRTISINY